MLQNFFVSNKASQSSLQNQIIFSLSLRLKGKNTVNMVKEGNWDPQGSDCAYVLRGLHMGSFQNWDGFEKDSAFNAILERDKSNRCNLKINFNKTVARYNEFVNNGMGKLF